MRDSGITLRRMNELGYSVANLKQAGFTAFELRSLDVEDEAMEANLKDAGYTAEQMKDANVSLDRLVELGYSVKNLKDAGYTATELIQTTYTA